ncbi:MAG: TerC/Alx family metal homeostasis membrane protein [Alphaproteobacteria bacterium]|nr:TerC/Alx family metal homeostasis membrane protein [Alphaproteobacteria bacterium]
MLENLEYSFTHHAVLSQGLMWTCFAIAVLVLLFLDLFVFNRKNEVPSFAHTLWICVAYIGAGLLFGVFVWYEEGVSKAMEYFTGFLVEKSLSMDNIFVMSVIFSSLGVPRIYQHRVLFWGILGAIVMRALLIGVGEVLISNFHWVLYLFSAFLIYTGTKMALDNHSEEEENNEEKIKNSKIYRVVEKYFPVTHKIDGAHFITCKNGKHYITPLLFALITIEVMDVVFALDSIPAIFLLTSDVFIVYTSNIFAILGLRALYFLLEAAVYRFKYLKHALSIVLIFIGAKIFLPFIGIELQTWHSLAVTFTLLFGSIFLSLFKEKQQAQS